MIFLANVSCGQRMGGDVDSTASSQRAWLLLFQYLFDHNTQRLPRHWSKAGELVSGQFVVPVVL
jgi:hypothetical protein